MKLSNGYGLVRLVICSEHGPIQRPSSLSNIGEGTLRDAVDNPFPLACWDCNVWMDQLQLLLEGSEWPEHHTDGKRDPPD